MTELQFKKLLYRSTHRGCKETDFLIGEFAKEKVAAMTAEERDLFEKFLEEDDLKIYDWILAKEKPDQQYEKLIARMQKFLVLKN